MRDRHELYTSPGERIKARRQEGEDLAQSWAEGFGDEVLPYVLESPPVLAATLRALLDAGARDGAATLCERVMAAA